jgi:CBS domain-containing protein
MRVGTPSPIRLVMAVPVVSTDPTMTLRTAAMALRDEDIGAVAVLGRDGLDGVLSERDIVRALAAGADPDETSVASAMVDDPVSVGVETPIGDVADVMLDTGIRHVPVVVGHDVVGMVSIRDVLDVIRSDQTRDAGA